MCKGWLPVNFVIDGRETKQALYICETVDRLYFSRVACVDVGILSPSFPHPQPVPSLSNVAGVGSDEPLTLPSLAELPVRPDTLPFPASDDNVDQLKGWLMDAFDGTTFYNEGLFPLLCGPSGHIHLRPNASPRARHKPIPVPFHLKEATRLGLMKDVERGIIAPVPIGTPTEWCSTMVITVKKDGRPRRTVDYQYLNSQCQCETHHTSSPFHLALQVPPDTKKTVLDAVDGYHSVPLDAESQPLTTFITEWGRFMYLRMPQGYLAPGDAYTRRYDEVIKNVERKVKCVDDVLLYDSGIEETFYHTFDYLTLCAKNGVVQNRKKFQFCQDTVQFAGLQLTLSGVAPSQSMLSAIQDFPTPQNITDAWSWFGLVNQVAWAFSLGPVMQPFRDLVKPSSKFVWDQSLEEAFQKSKAQIIDLVKDGISTFDIERTTCLAPDWSKEGMGFLLLQKYCSCANDKAPTCCSEGWHLVFAGSRFCTPAESRYAPIEGEAAAIAWALHKCRMFVAGCQDLIVTTDHQPLTGVFGDRDLSGITNPRLFKLKEKTLQYRFTIQHRQGKWHRGSDAMSRHPAAVVKAVYDVCCVCPTEVELQEADAVEDAVRSVTIEAMADYGDDLGVISPYLVRAAGCADRNYMTLVNTVERGFPGTRHLTDPGIREFLEVRHRLSTENGLVLLDRRIVIPLSHRKRVLRCLHAAHQGVVGMKARANISVYWPGMDAAIRNYHASCCVCMTIAPSLPQETIVLTPSPQWPFQKICMDMFDVDQVSYLACVDRFSGWLIIYHFRPGQATAQRLISICRELFQTYGAPEELSSDGGSVFTSYAFQNFLTTWGVDHRLSSVAYPQSNGRAELAVKSAKRIIHGNTGPDGSLDNDRVARAVLQCRNTPIQGLGLSPAQMLLNRRLRDFLPAQPCLYKPHPAWVIAAERRETALASRNSLLAKRYNRFAQDLQPMQLGDNVAVQNNRNDAGTALALW